MPLISLLPGCPAGGTLEDPECYSQNCDGSGGGPPTTCDGPEVMARKCGSLPCHQGSDSLAAFSGLELLTPPSGMTLAQSLLNRPATYELATEFGCTIGTPELIIDELEPARSLLLTKVTGGSGVDFVCGDEMPSTRLPDTDIACLTEWVNAVASSAGL